MTPRIIGFEDADARLDWSSLVAALVTGHNAPKAEIADSFLYRDTDTLLSRAAWITGLGQLVKTATIFPANAAQGHPNIHGAVTLFSDATGALEALIDFHLVTKWKTAGDSLLAATRLAPSNARKILIIGAGTVARSMVAAYASHFTGAEINIWARDPGKAALCAQACGAGTRSDLQAAVTEADIICTTTMAKTPVVLGDWLRPGQHLDLIGAYRPDMREVDDTALRRARLFVDSLETVPGHIGELMIPLQNGVIAQSDILADYYKMDRLRRESDSEITICKNGGGAHLDLMTSRYILDTLSQAG